MRHYSREDYSKVFDQVLGTPTGVLTPTGPNVWAESVNPQWQVGSRYVVNNGGISRTFHYSRINPLITAAMDRGRVMFTSDTGVERGAFLGAQTGGSYTVNWTSVGAIVAHQYDHGFMLLQGGRTLEIKSHGVAAAGGVVVPFVFYDPIPETIAAGRAALIQENPYANVRQMQATGVETLVPGCVMGVYNMYAPNAHAGYYTWLQTWGPCGVISADLTLGDALLEHTIRAGIVATDDQVNVGAAGDQFIGNLMISAAQCTDAENFIIVDLKIRP